jgi:hypothetical protein
MRFWTFWRGMHPQRDTAGLPPRPAPALDVDSEMLDSSHIGFAPLISPLEPPYEGGPASAGDSEPK